MLHYIIDDSERIDVNKISESKDSDICYYWHFLNKALNFHQMSAIDVIIY